jgi:quinol monooxygenase YgiN
MRIKPGQVDDFISTMRSLSPAPSSVAMTIYKADGDPDVVWIAGVHQSREAYKANSESPEQAARFAQLKPFFADEAPQWHDGEVAYFDVREQVRS